jgi:hypothetical protein
VHAACFRCRSLRIVAGHRSGRLFVLTAWLALVLLLRVCRETGYGTVFRMRLFSPATE